MKTLLNDIKTQTFKPVYLLYGEEKYLLQQYAAKLKLAIVPGDDTMNASSFEGADTDPDELIALSETFPFFAERRCIFIENSGFFKKCPDRLVDYIASIPETTCLIFSETELDKRSRLYKQVVKHGRAVEFLRQKEDVIIQWILGKLKKENKNITRSVMDLFLEKTGNDMALIDAELEKLLSYTLGKETIEAEDVEAVCSSRIDGKIFEMIDAIASRQQTKALDLYYDLLMLREAPMRILILITRHFRTLLLIREMTEQGHDYRYMAEKAKVREFAVRKYVGQARQFSMQQLKDALRAGIRAEEDIKTGKMKEQVAAELLLISLSAK